MDLVQNKEKVLRLLEQRTNVISETGCWEYEGKNSVGYGQITIDGEFHYVHRISAILFLGYNPIYSELLHVLHHCHNPCCWNFNHLYIGTNDENIADRMNANRSRNQNTDSTHCKHGHEFTEENTYWCLSANGNKRRQCRECKAIVNRESKLRRFGKVG